MNEVTNKKKSFSDMIGIIITIIGGCCWGLSGTCGQFLFEYKDVTSKWLVPVRLTTAGIIMLVYFLAREKKDALRIWKDKRNAIDVIVYGIAGMMLCQFTYFYTIELSNAGTATVIQYLAPAMIMVLVCMGEKRLPKLLELTALALAVLGIFLLATHGDIHHLAISKEALVVGLISAVTVVIYNLQPKRLLSQYEAPYILSWGLTIGGIVLSCIFKPWEYTVQFDLGVFLGLFGVIGLGSIGGFSLYMQGVKLIGPARASLYSCVEPIAAMILSAVWLKVPFAPIDLVGSGCIIATILILGFMDLKKDL